MLTHNEDTNTHTNTDTLIFSVEEMNFNLMGSGYKSADTHTDTNTNTFLRKER